MHVEKTEVDFDRNQMCNICLKFPGEMSFLPLLRKIMVQVEQISRSETSW